MMKTYCDTELLFRYQLWRTIVSNGKDLYLIIFISSYVIRLLYLHFLAPLTQLCCRCYNVIFDMVIVIIAIIIIINA